MSKYIKLDQREHVLKRPNMYIGSVEEDIYNTYVFNEEENTIVKKDIKFIPGLYKIFDEILVNAIDHITRLKEQNSEHLVKNIKIDIDKENNIITVLNDGQGIDVEKHDEYDMYIPELIFGHLLTSSNYDDNQERTIGGLNGIGAKAVSIFSSYFKLTTVDYKKQLKYTQLFENNLSKINKPSVTKYTRKPFTSIEFKPDYEKFNTEGLSDDMYNIIIKRIYDACAITDNNINIYLNSKKLEYKNFEKYTTIYIGNEKKVYEKINDRWEIIVSINNNNTGFQQVSFVNGIWTIKGGKHVDCILNQITKKLGEIIVKKNKNITVSPKMIKDSLILFVKCIIPNPTFDSQSKEVLTTALSKIKVEVDDKTIDKIYKLGIIDRIVQFSNIQNNKLSQKTDGKKKSIIKGIPQLEDAHLAGTSKSKDCILILTEGLSASSMAISGISVVGKDKYGVFPLKGKILNVKDVSEKKIIDNDEISNLKKIIGLQSGKDYSKNKDELRYNQIMIMTDQDSVIGDTPVLLKKDNKIYIEAIENLSTEWKLDINGKEYGTTDFQVWTDEGWTDIIHIMRHKVKKNIYRVLTHTGIVDVTEDHSLLNIKGEKITPKECDINGELLHSFPDFNENKINIPDDINDLSYRDICKIASSLKIKQYQTKKKYELISIIEKYKLSITEELIYEEHDISCDEAYVMGLFWADGSCGIYEWEYTQKRKDRPRAYTFNRISYSWAISNNEKSLLEKSKNILSDIYKDINFSIVECKNKDRSNINYKLIANGGIKTKYLIEKYMKFYYKTNTCKYKNGNKIIPMYILNSSRNIREQFLDGYYCGDGSTHDISNKSLSMDVESKISCQSIFYLCKSLGYLVSINHQGRKPNVYTLTITKGHQQDNPNRIKKIWNLGVTEQYVYDFETKNHHFQAGIGQLIIHNTDGSHIKGLLFNLFHTLWPSLITNDGFTSSLLTPIVKAKKGSECIQFYSLTDYENWKNNITNIKSWNIKYYKGLGTSDSKEAKEYFKEMKKIEYKWDDESNECIDLAFNKKRADDRKAWLSEYNRNNILDYTNMNVTYPEFIHKDLIHFSNYDIERSIPSMIDGLKTSQRKILYSCFKRNLIDKEIRVSQLAAYISENTCYHHGEASLQSTIVGMAQDFVCSNNINLLMPIGQFGSRIHGGKDAGQSRYIHTMLSKECCNIFKKEDRNILNYLDDDGTSIEPQFYIPTIPMILVNGALGIATGFSTNIPCFNPNDITEVLKLLIKNENVDNYELKPWYKGFNGEIFKKEDKYFSKGVYKKNKNKIIVTELPIGVWIYDYKCHLEDILDVSNSKYLSDFKSYENNSSDTIVNIELVFNNENVINDYLNTIENNGFNKFENNFKMITSKQLSMTNMYAFNENGQIQKFSNPIDIIKRFYEVRLEYYSKRKEYICNNITNELNIMNNKIRFITDVIEEKLIIHKIKKIELDDYLDNNNYDKINDNYDYIIKIPIYNFTIDKVDNLIKEKESLNEKFNHIKNKSIEDMWDDELLKFDICDKINVNINVKKKAIKKI